MLWKVIYLHKSMWWCYFDGIYRLFVYWLLFCYLLGINLLDVEYFSYYFSCLFVFCLGTEVVKPYTPVLPFLPLDFQEPSCHDSAHIYLMIKIYSCGLFTQALDHLQIGKYMLKCFSVCFFTLSFQFCCLGIGLFLLFTLYIRTYL